MHELQMGGESKTMSDDSDEYVGAGCLWIIFLGVLLIGILWATVGHGGR